MYESQVAAYNNNENIAIDNRTGTENENKNTKIMHV